MTRIVVISDTHGLHRALRIPAGDILIHAGDMTRTGALSDLRAFDRWLGTLPHRHKVVIAGNHDWCWAEDGDAARQLLTHAIYLQDAAVQIDGWRLYGSPWQPVFYHWAFNLPRGRALREKWDAIPHGTDILITHGPPAGFHDQNTRGEHTGCVDLRHAVERLRPPLHCFGHIHEGAGTSSNGRTTFINASVCTVMYQPTNAPVVYHLLPK